MENVSSKIKTTFQSFVQIIFYWTVDESNFVNNTILLFYTAFPHVYLTDFQLKIIKDKWEVKRTNEIFGLCFFNQLVF